MLNEKEYLEEIEVDGGLSILLVEDNSVDRRIFSHNLKQICAQESLQGVSLSTARSISEAMEHLSREHCDVVVLDLGLPDSSGLSGLESLVAKYPGVAVVILSAYSDRDLATKAIHKGAVDYFLKGVMKPGWVVRDIISATTKHRRRMTLSSVGLAGIKGEG